MAGVTFWVCETSDSETAIRFCVGVSMHGADGSKKKNKWQRTKSLSLKSSEPPVRGLWVAALHRARCLQEQSTPSARPPSPRDRLPLAALAPTSSRLRLLVSWITETWPYLSRLPVFSKLLPLFLSWQSVVSFQTTAFNVACAPTENVSLTSCYIMLLLLH